jgi:RNA polymerase sigma-70 factor (ECF subfamily)
MTAVLDAELMRRAALGERAAVAALYDRHSAVLLGVALRVVGARADAEDVLHDMFVSLPQRARYYTSDRGTVIAWMVILVRNAAIDRLRRYGRASAIGLTLDAEPNGSNPEDNTIAASTRRGVRLALAALPEAQRRALEAAFFEGLTYAQIAERDGLPLNTVKSRCARALLALREALANAELNTEDASDRR